MQNNVAYASDAANEPHTQLLCTNLQKSNAFQKELVSLIEDKLHAILNLRIPQSEDRDKTSDPILSDFVQAINYELDKTYAINTRLEKIVEHLRKIV